jgi:hypothetical protein
MDVVRSTGSGGEYDDNGNNPPHANDGSPSVQELQ